LGEEIGAVEARLTVHVGGVNGRAFQGFGRATMERDVVVLANGSEDRGGIAGCVAVPRMPMMSGLYFMAGFL